MTGVAVIATVLNERETVSQLLASIAAQQLCPDEVVLVDGGSTDGTWELLSSGFPGLPQLRSIQDTSCSFPASSGPIARGRNVAIAASTSAILACCDAGCRYAPGWLAKLTAPIRSGAATYALGGSCLDLHSATSADIASAPFLGVKLAPHEPTRSCTARSMAFTREAWKSVEGFPETLFIGEDVLFDQHMRAAAQTAFVPDAKAIYTPGNTFRSALAQVASYAVADGVAGMRPARLLRNLLRCLAGIATALLVLWTVWPFTVYLALEIYFAFRLDWRYVRPLGVRVLSTRLAFSLLVPFVVTVNQLLGARCKRYRTNRQNLATSPKPLP